MTFNDVLVCLKPKLLRNRNFEVEHYNAQKWPYPVSVSPSVFVFLVLHFQRSSSLKPHAHSKSNLYEATVGKGNQIQPSLMTKMATTPIYGKYPLKIFSRTSGPISWELGM